jgi:hypothetical protein
VPVLHVGRLKPTTLGQLNHRFGRIIEILSQEIAHFVRGKISEVEAGSGLHYAVGFPKHPFNLRQTQVRENTMRVYVVEMGLGGKSIGRFAEQVDIGALTLQDNLAPDL